MEKDVPGFDLEERLLELRRVGRDRWARRIPFAAGPAVPPYLGKASQPAA